MRRRLADAVAAGQWLDLLPDPDHSGGRVLDEQVMRAWGPDQDLDADDLAAVVRGRSLPADTMPHPRGVRVRGARIRGRLDLNFLTDAVPLLLVDCLLDDGVSAYAAHLPYLELRRCRITHPTGTPLAAAGVHVDDDLRLTGSVITAPRADRARSRWRGPMSAAI